MKLIAAVDIARSCGLKTVMQAYQNIDIHAMMIFAYPKIGEELNELANEIAEVFDELGIDQKEGDLSIEEYEKYIGGKYNA